jgi:membrane protein
MSATVAGSRPAGADLPIEVPAADWKDVVRGTIADLKHDNIALLSAGVAFFALLAFVPALVAFISIYGLVADPADVSRHVSDLLGAAPVEVRNLVVTQLREIAEGGRGRAGAGAVVGVVVALWSASSGMKHAIRGVNIAFDIEERRPFLRLRALALVMTLGAVAFVITAFAVLAVLPAAIAGAPTGVRLAVDVARWPVIGLAWIVALALFYRFAPARDEPRFVWASSGSLAATVIWLAGSAVFSLYTANFGRYDETYGSLGAVVVVMLWLLLTAFAVLVGAELNSHLERRAGEVGEAETAGGAEGAGAAP